MEVIIVASAVSHLALRFFDKYANKLVENTPRETSMEDTTHSPSSNTDIGLTNIRRDKRSTEGSIPSLELKLKSLRLQAKELNSSDTFVQYARISREANKVEKELNERREQEGIRENGLDIENIAQLFSTTLGPSATGIMHRINRKARSFAMKFALHVVVFSALWWYFSWNPHAGNGSVMVIDCRAVRPLTFLLPKQIPSCAEEDWVCAASPLECRIPFTFAFGMCNVVLAMIAKAFT